MTEPALNQFDLTSDVSTLSISELAHLVRVLVPLTAPATNPPARSLASARLARIPGSAQLITYILTHIVKPVFAPTPHPRLHTSTARILPRPADVQDTYIEQPWKDHPGLDEIIRWCLLNTESSAYETSWPLFLPPIMTFLDDYQVPYKLLGVRLVSDLLSRVPSDLLLQTGIDALVFTSLSHSLSHLGDDSTPDFIRLTVTTALQLIDLTSPSLFPSGEVSQCGDRPQGTPTTDLERNLSPTQYESLSTRFSRLSTLLSTSLLGTIIMYTPTFLPPATSSTLDSDPFADQEHVNTNPVGTPEPLMPKKSSFNPTLVAAAQSLPPVLLALGISGARFLKGVVPVLAEWLVLPIPIFIDGAGMFTVDITLHLASLSGLSVLLHTCAPRIGGWSTTIVDALGRCWVGCLDTESKKECDFNLETGLTMLKQKLREIAVQLAGVYPGVTKEYAVLLAFDKALFEGLVEGLCNNVNDEQLR